MKTASGALQTLLATSKSFTVTELLTITTIDATVYRYTSADVPVVYGGNTYGALPFVRNAVRTVIGVEVATLDLELYPASTDLLGTVSMSNAAVAGALDGATVVLDRLFMPTWGDTSLGTVNVFSGTVQDLAVSRSSVRVTVAAGTNRLNINMPRNVYAPTCIHTLFDGGCGLTASLFALGVTVAAGATTTQLTYTGTSRGTDYFVLGRAVFTSGPNVGLSRSIIAYDGANLLTLAPPLPVAPATGNGLTLYPGCKKTQAVCSSAKFSNLANFRGMPYVPSAETAY